MKKCLLFVVAVTLTPIAAFAQSRPVMVVRPFTTAADVTLPYDMKLLQTQLVAEFKVLLGKQLDIVAEPPETAPGNLYTLDAEIVSWRPGNAAKRILVGLGSGREALDLQYRVTDRSSKTVVDRKDTIRTNFYSQMAGSTGTLAHPIAQKVADRIKDANLR